MGSDDWLLQDELEKYEAKIHLEKLLINSYESAFSEKIEFENSKLGSVKEELKNGMARLDHINNPNGMSCKTWIFLTNERCFHLANQLNTLKCNRRKKQHKLRSTKNNLETIQKELAKKRDNIHTNQKTMKELQEKLDGILSNQKQALLTNQRQVQMQQDLHDAKLRFPPMLKEMEKFLDTQTRDTREFKIILKQASEIAAPIQKEDARYKSKEELLRLLKESLDQQKLELLKEKRFCKYNLRQLHKNRERNHSMKQEMRCADIPDGPIGSRRKQEDDWQQNLAQIGKVAERMLGGMERPRQMGELGDSRFEDFTKELLSIAKLCSSSTSSSAGTRSSTPQSSFRNSRPKMSASTGWDPIASEGSRITSWATITSGSFSESESAGTPTSMYTTKSSFSLPSLHEPSSRWT